MKILRIIVRILILILFVYGAYIERQTWNFEFEQDGFLYMFREYTNHRRLNIALTVASMLTIYIAVLKTFNRK